MKKKKFIFIAIVSLIGIGFLFTQCSKEERIPQQDVPQQEQMMVQMEPNPTPGEIEIPKATAELKQYEFKPYFKNGDPTSSLLPATFSATLAEGESVDEIKEGYIMGAPPLGDVMFCMDLTGSMGGELNNAKVNSVNIMNAVGAVISNTQFGVMSHMDYVGDFASCDYFSTYGEADWGDYPYSLDQAITDNPTLVTAALNGLVLGSGYDGPENYTRPLFESYSDANVAWRTGAKKIMVAWLDHIPHDCNVYAAIGGTRSTGKDPGRDEVVGTADDLAILDVLNEMNNNNITLIVLNSGGSYYQTLWEAFTAITGGTAVQINSDGSIPGGTDIGQYIADLILDEVSTIDDITLEVCTPGFEGWLTYVEPFDPSSYMFDPEFPAAWTDEADITITVPVGTAEGDYFFDICLIGDGAEYGRQEVTITVQNVIEVPFDVYPTSCPNPINRNGGGVIPMAILGTADFDVTQIDVGTIMVLGVAPTMWALEDVATPYYPFIGKILDNMSCNTYEGDGLEDLTLKFDKADLAAMLAGYSVGDVVALTITGQLIDGTDFIGEDIIWIIK